MKAGLQKLPELLSCQVVRLFVVVVKDKGYFWMCIRSETTLQLVVPAICGPFAMVSAKTFLRIIKPATQSNTILLSLNACYWNPVYNATDVNNYSELGGQNRLKGIYGSEESLGTKSHLPYGRV